MPLSLGDFATSTVLDFMFTTIDSTGAPTNMAGTPAVSVYKGSNTTESTSGVTLTAPFDSRVGMNHVTIDTSSDGTFYATGQQFSVIITAGTVAGISVVNYTLAYFTLNAVSSLRPTTAARTLGVDASGRVDVGSALGTAVTLDTNNVLNVSAKYLAGTALTGRDIGTSVLLSSGAGTGQLDFTSGVVKANLAQILGTALTETAGLIAAGFKQFFNIASPTSTMNRVTLVDTVTAVTGLTASNLDATISSRMATYTQPTGFLAATFPAGTVANTTNITAGTLTTLTDLTTTANAEVTAPPASNAALSAKISWLFLLSKNMITQTATTMLALANDSSTTVGTSSTSDDGTTYTRGKFS